MISVGATSEIDAVLLNSDRGPSPDGLLKPELSAPGSNIVSCWYGYDNYRTTTDVTLVRFDYDFEYKLYNFRQNLFRLLPT